MADFILGTDVRSQRRRSSSCTYLQRRTTTHEIVLICTQVVGANVRLDNIEVCNDRLVADEAVPRAELTERYQLQRNSEKRKGVYHEPAEQVGERQPREVENPTVFISIKEWVGRQGIRSCHLHFSGVYPPTFLLTVCEKGIWALLQGFNTREKCLRTSPSKLVLESQAQNGQKEVLKHRFQRCT